MAQEFVDVNQLMFTDFEPKMMMRFIFLIDGIPTYLIKKADRPKFDSAEVVLPHINTERYVKGKTKWQSINVELYDPISPSGAQLVMNWVRLGHESVTGRDGYASMYQKDVVMQMIGPVGDIVEEWQVKSAWIQSADFGSGDWADESTPMTINLTLRYNFAILQF